MGCYRTHPAVTAAGNADCRTVLRGVLPFQTDGKSLSFGWVAIDEFFERWVVKHQNSRISRILWVAVFRCRSVINSLTLSD